MDEAQLGKEIERLAKENDVLYHHCRDSRFCSASPGLPDYILVGRDHTLFVELKDWGRQTSPQRQWAKRIVDNGGDFELWTPYDLKTGHIQEIMQWL